MVKKIPGVETDIRFDMVKKIPGVETDIRYG